MTTGLLATPDYIRESIAYPPPTPTAPCLDPPGLAEHAHRFAYEQGRDSSRLSRRVDSAAERLSTGADVSYGFYLERPTYLSLAVVTCSPNRSTPTLPCPLG